MESVKGLKKNLGEKDVSSCSYYCLVVNMRILLSCLHCTSQENLRSCFVQVLQNLICINLNIDSEFTTDIPCSKTFTLFS